MKAGNIDSPNVTIGQSQRGGATFSLGTNLGFGTIGVNYTGATGTFGGSYDVIERDFNGVKFSSELNYDGKEGLSISGNADFGNGLGLGVENGRNGTTGSLTILGSQQGTVDVNGNYTANENFLGEINGQDMADLADTVERRRLAEENERNPAKNAKDAKDAATNEPEEGPSGLVDVGAALLAGGFAWAAAKLAGGGSSSSSPRAPAGNTANAETPVVGRKPRDEDEEDGKVKGEGDTTNEPPKKQPTKEELANFKDNIFLNTTRAATDAYLDKLDAQGVDTSEMRAHAEAQLAAGVRDLTPEEIKLKKFDQEMKTKGSYLDPDTGNFYVKQPDGGLKKFMKDENGKDIVIHTDKDGNSVIRPFSAMTDLNDLPKIPRQEAKIELANDTEKPLKKYGNEKGLANIAERSIKTNISITEKNNPILKNLDIDTIVAREVAANGGNSNTEAKRKIMNDIAEANGFENSDELRNALKKGVENGGTDNFIMLTNYYDKKIDNSNINQNKYFSRKLVSSEKQILNLIFGDKFDVNKVKIDYTSKGNNFHKDNKLNFGEVDFNEGNPTREVFVHEAAHAYVYQNPDLKTKYPEDKSYKMQETSDPYLYDYAKQIEDLKYDPSKSNKFNQLTHEAQARLIQNTVELTLRLKNNSLYVSDPVVKQQLIRQYQMHTQFIKHWRK